MTEGGERSEETSRVKRCPLELPSPLRRSLQGSDPRDRGTPNLLSTTPSPDPSGRKTSLQSHSMPSGTSRRGYRKVDPEGRGTTVLVVGEKDLGIEGGPLCDTSLLCLILIDPNTRTRTKGSVETPSKNERRFKGYRRREGVSCRISCPRTRPVKGSDQ